MNDTEQPSVTHMYGGFALPFIVTRWRRNFLCAGEKPPYRQCAPAVAGALPAAGGSPLGWDEQTQRAATCPTGLPSDIRVVFPHVIFVRGRRSVGSHDVSGHGGKIRGLKRTLIAEPAARTIDGQRPPVIDESAKERQLLAAQESVANKSSRLRRLLRFHITTKPRSHSGNARQPPWCSMSLSPAGPM